MQRIGIYILKTRTYTLRSERERERESMRVNLWGKGLWDEAIGLALVDGWGDGRSQSTPPNEAANRDEPDSI